MGSQDLHRAVAKLWGEAGSACVGLASTCRQEGCCWHLLFDSLALLGVKYEQFVVFLQLWRPPSIRVCQSLENICHARAVNREMVSGEATAPQQLQWLLVCTGTEVSPAASSSLPKIRRESNIIPTCACPEKG